MRLCRQGQDIEKKSLEQIHCLEQQVSIDYSERNSYGGSRMKKWTRAKMIPCKQKYTREQGNVLRSTIW